MRELGRGGTGAAGLWRSGRERLFVRVRCTEWGWVIRLVTGASPARFPEWSSWWWVMKTWRMLCSMVLGVTQVRHFKIACASAYIDAIRSGGIVLHDVRLHIWRAPASRVKVHAASPTKYRAASCESRRRSRVNDHVPQPVRPHTRVDTHTEAAASQTLQVGSLGRRRSSRHMLDIACIFPPAHRRQRIALARCGPMAALTPSVGDGHASVQQTMKDATAFSSIGA